MENLSNTCGNLLGFVDLPWYRDSSDDQQSDVSTDDWNPLEVAEDEIDENCHGEFLTDWSDANYEHYGGEKNVEREALPEEWDDVSYNGNDRNAEKSRLKHEIKIFAGCFRVFDEWKFQVTIVQEDNEALSNDWSFSDRETERQRLHNMHKNEPVDDLDEKSSDAAENHFLMKKKEQQQSSDESWDHSYSKFWRNFQVISSQHEENFECLQKHSKQQNCWYFIAELDCFRGAEYRLKKCEK